MFQARQNVLSLSEIERRNDVGSVEPLIDAKLLTYVVALQDFEFLIEFFAEFALPLECQVGGANNQNALG